MNRSVRRRESGSRRRSSGRLSGTGASALRFSTRLQFSDTISQFLNIEDERKQEDGADRQERIEEDDEGVESISSSEEEEEENREKRSQNKRQSRALTASMVKMTKSGSRAIKWSKVFVFAMLLVVATVILVWTYIFLKEEAKDDFEFGFKNLSLEMLARVNVKMSKMESALRSISILITDYTQSDEAAVWPFVTVPNWQIRAISTQEMSKAVVLGMSPLVPVEDIRLWEEYSLYSYQNWIGDTLDQQEKLLQQINLLSSGQMQQYTQIWEDEIAKEHLSIPEYVYQISPKFGPYVPNTDELNTNRGFVMPTWELAPAPRHNLTIVNYNLLNHTVIANAVEQLLQTRQPVLTPAFPDIHWLWKGAVAPGGIQSDIIAKNSGQFQPCSLLLQPIFEAIPKNDVENSLVLDPEQQQQQQQQQQHGGVSSPKLVGIAYALIPWSVYMEQNLADRTMRGVHAVLDWKPASEGCYESNRISSGSTPPDESTIHPVFTYRIDGKHAAFVGYGDLHESRYEYMMESMDFHFPTDPRQRPANASECAYGHYQWRVYPTEDMKETNFNPSNVGPWMYAMGVVAIFCVAGGIFLSYDYLVQLRQQAVLDTAIRSNAIVSSLFPSNVRDRIMKDAEEQAKQEARQRKLERKQRKKKKRRKKKAAQAADQVTNETDSLGMPKHQLKDFLNEVTNGGGVNSDDLGYGEAQPSVHVPEPPAAFGSKPIADLFPNATVLFADIIGFSAWSSVREPTQVFQLLESLYHHFDEIAARRNVFKVETIGDCYVAVTGLPEPRRDHALVMCRFAKDIMAKMKEICPKLEVILGPDTGELQLRIGIHSGPVTAGVLRGEKSRFQLFGDTVNTAARMESTGLPNKMHISKETADLLKAAGKKWAKKREDKVYAKGKGELETYWLAPGKTVSVGSMSSSASSSEGEDEGDAGELKTMPILKSRNGMSNTLMNTNSEKSLRRSSHHLRRSSHADKKNSLHGSSKKAKENAKKNGRLIQWNAEVLVRLLKQIKARREAIEQTTGEEAGADSKLDDDDDDNSSNLESILTEETDDSNDDDEFGGSETKTTVFEEIKEIIHLPVFKPRAASTQQDITDVEIDKKARDQCQEFVREVAAMYRWNPFHNFEHASHVTMSVVKLLSRIVAPEAAFDQNANKEDREHNQLMKSWHDNTYGITSDPLTQFAVVFSALIHDLDHPGVPNATLVKEGTSLATLYKNKSVAEQNSVDLTWEILMEDRFKDFRMAIYSNRLEKRRFRQLVVNVVMATDIIDSDLKKLRNARWDKAFQEKSLESKEELREDINRKATIVLEHMIQASDVAHTMQHWNIYCKWNERFFEECYQAYMEGRAEKDPSEYWYEGEIGFFDFYIIPLAKKLKDCKVFGVSSDEYLNYAESNKKQWEDNGREVVQSFVARYSGNGGSKKKNEAEAE